jgi:hypothetical protein
VSVSVVLGVRVVRYWEWGEGCREDRRLRIRSIQLVHCMQTNIHLSPIHPKTHSTPSHHFNLPSTAFQLITSHTALKYSALRF